MESIRDSIVHHVTQLIYSQTPNYYHAWKNLLEQGYAFNVVYKDFAKAFDSVPHTRPLVKLRNFGIKGNVLKWIDSFLTARKQCVIVQGMQSGWKPMVSGIPQGSVIGPILFVCFINDLLSKVKYNMYKLFADDFKIYGVVDLPRNMSTIQSDLNDLSYWSEYWQLLFNETQCKSYSFWIS